MVAAGTARDRRVAWVIRLDGVLEGGVDREQRVGAGEFGDPVQRPAGPDRESHLSAPDGGLRWALSRCRMAEQSRHAVQVRSAMTTVTPGVKAALICSAACSAVAASIWAGRVTMTGGEQVSWPGHVCAAPSGR